MPANSEPERGVDPLIGFARKFGLISGLVGVLLAAIGVGLGLSGDAVLDQARVGLAIAALITGAAFAILVGPRITPLVRSVGMGIAALAYHLTLSQWWLPWIENYKAVAANGDDAAIWEEAAALPLLIIGGIFMVVAAVFLWPTNRSRTRAPQS